MRKYCWLSRGKWSRAHARDHVHVSLRGVFLRDDPAQDQWSKITYSNLTTLTLYIKWTDVSFPRLDSSWSVPLMSYDLSDLESLVLIRIIPMGRTLGTWTSYKERWLNFFFVSGKPLWDNSVNHDSQLKSVTVCPAFLLMYSVLSWCTTITNSPWI